MAFLQFLQLSTSGSFICSSESLGFAKCTHLVLKSYFRQSNHMIVHPFSFTCKIDNYIFWGIFAWHLSAFKGPYASWYDSRLVNFNCLNQTFQVELCWVKTRPKIWPDPRLFWSTRSDPSNCLLFTLTAQKKLGPQNLLTRQKLKDLKPNSGKIKDPKPDPMAKKLQKQPYFQDEWHHLSIPALLFHVPLLCRSIFKTY